MKTSSWATPRSSVPESPSRTEPIKSSSDPPGWLENLRNTATDAYPKFVSGAVTRGVPRADPHTSRLCERQSLRHAGLAGRLAPCSSDRSSGCRCALRNRLTFFFPSIFRCCFSRLAPGRHGNLARAGTKPLKKTLIDHLFRFSST